MHQREAHEEHQVATGGSVWNAPQLRLLRRDLRGFGTYYIRLLTLRP